MDIQWRSSDSKAFASYGSENRPAWWTPAWRTPCWCARGSMRAHVLAQRRGWTPASPRTSHARGAGHSAQVGHPTSHFRLVRLLARMHFAPSLTGASTERLDTCGAAPWPPGARSAIWQLATLETHPRTRGARTRLSVASEVSWVQVGATWRAALLAAYGSSRAAGSGASSARLAQVCSHAGCVLRHAHGWSLSNFSCGFVSPSECHGRCPARYICRRRSTSLETTTKKLRLVILSSRPFHRPHLELLTPTGAHNQHFFYWTGPPIPWLEPSLL